MKTMRKKCLKQSLSILLTVIFACSMIPTAIAAQLTAEKSEASKIVREITDLREESVKHFLCEDGSYIAATYAVPVHYQENGVWKEIDNSLSLTSRTIDASAKSAYAPKAGSVDVNLPQSFADGQKITARNGEHTLSFGVSADAKNVSIGKQAAVTKVDALPSVVMEEKELTTATTLPDNVVSSKAVYESASVQDYNDEKMAVANQSGAVVYKGIFDDADLEYIVSSNCVKENIVVYAPQKTYTYTFNMDFGDLIPAQQKNGSIWLLESADADEPVFVLETPYMYDADHMDSYAVTMSLKPNGDGYAVTVEADAEWINSAERTFPVVIDPTIEYSNVSYFDDMYVINGLGSNSSHRNTELRVGRNLTNLARTYIQISLPSNIPENGVVTNATLTLKQKSYYQAWNQSNVNIKVFDCDHAHGYAFNAITWNNQPFSTSNTGYTSNGATQLDQKPATSSANSYSFTITDALRRWATEDRALQQNQGQGTGGTQNANDNHYLMLASDNESSKTQIDLGSTRISDTSKRPVVTIAYVNASLIFSAVPGEITTWPVDSTGDLQSFVVSPSRVWTVDVDAACQSWVSVENINLVGFRIRVEENTSVYTRSGCITVRFDSVTEVVKVINIVQMGIEPTLYMNENQLYSYSEGGTLYVELFSNTSWSVESIVTEPFNEIVTEDPVSVSPMSGDGNATLEITVNGNRDTVSILHTVTVKTTVGSETTETITIKQFDKVSDLFSNITNGNICNIKPSTVYNHSLATWAMEMSYIAYNYLDGETELALIPGIFMDGVTSNIQTVLNDEYGFDVTPYCYGSNESGAHVIALRDIVTGYNNTNSGQIRPLIVVVIRGSVTPGDWLNNFCTEINSQQYSFSALKNVVKSNLDSVMGSYLNEDPVIMITGHSLGAAVANLLAADVSEEYGCENVYAYTFATPRTVNRLINQNVPSYLNIFNILNTNDVVTYVPFTVWLPATNLWTRYGISFSINMPWNDENVTAYVGLFCHAMSTYMNWMNSFSDLSYMEIQDLSDEARIRGILPWFVTIKCPVGVGVLDGEGEILAYESQEPTPVVEDPLEYVMASAPFLQSSRITSWITEDGEKVFFLPQGSGADHMDITAYGYGTMKISFAILDIENNLETSVIDNISLYPGKTFTVDISGVTYSEDAQLIVTENGAPIGEAGEMSPYLKSAMTNDSHVIYGTTSTMTVVTSRNVSEVSFIDQRNNTETTYSVNNPAVLSIVDDGETLTWIIQDVFPVADYIFDVGVKVEQEWHQSERMFAIKVDPVNS